ncbi:MAG: hypothetical protein IPG77_14205 [Betaproteobacteria bacterium]|nr:hypothetical protein [Betaproteobacteria bacterium]
MGIAVVVRRRRPARAGVTDPSRLRRVSQAWSWQRAADGESSASRSTIRRTPHERSVLPPAAVDGQPFPAFRQGQFLNLLSLEVAAGAGGEEPARRAITRRYSLSDRPDPAEYR